MRVMFKLLCMLLVFMAGCSTLLQDARVRVPPTVRHCQGSKSLTTFYTATIPIPLVAFVVPRVPSNEPNTAEILDDCGPGQLVNRSVQRNLSACVPTLFLTTIASLGIIGVCPSSVRYEADVIPAP